MREYVTVGWGGGAQSSMALRERTDRKERDAAAGNEEGAGRLLTKRPPRLCRNHDLVQRKHGIQKC